MKEENTFFEDYTNLINSFEALKKDANNPFFKSKYVILNQILPVVKQKCKEYGFILFQYLVTVDGDNCLKTTLKHIASGDGIDSFVKIISKDPNDPQKVGAGITYMRRYSLVTMFMLEDEDDDGNLASNTSNKATGSPYNTSNPKNTVPYQNTPISPPAPEYVPMGNTNEAVKKLNNYKKENKVVGEKCSACGEGVYIKSKAGNVVCNKFCWTNK